MRKLGVLVVAVGMLVCFGGTALAGEKLMVYTSMKESLIGKLRDAFAEYERLKDAYVLNRTMIERLRPDVTVLHPLPRVNEIATDVDALPNAAYFRQAQNGVFVRLALLALVLGAE